MRAKTYRLSPWPHAVYSKNCLYFPLFPFHQLYSQFKLFRRNKAAEEERKAVGVNARLFCQWIQTPELCNTLSTKHLQAQINRQREAFPDLEQMSDIFLFSKCPNRLINSQNYQLTFFNLSINELTVSTVGNGCTWCAHYCMFKA